MAVTRRQTRSLQGNRRAGDLSSTKRGGARVEATSAISLFNRPRQHPSQIMIRHHNNFEDFATLDRLVVDMQVKVNEMAEILRKAGENIDGASTSSPAFVFGPTFHKLDPVMHDMYTALGECIKIVSDPQPPSAHTLNTLATMAARVGETDIGDRMRNLNKCPTNWRDLSENLNIFPCTNCNVIAFLAEILRLHPRESPQFAPGFDPGRAYVYVGKTGLFYFAPNHVYKTSLVLGNYEYHINRFNGLGVANHEDSESDEEIN